MMTYEELRDARELWNVEGSLSNKAIRHIDEQERLLRECANLCREGQRYTLARDWFDNLLPKLEAFLGD